MEVYLREIIRSAGGGELASFDRQGCVRRSRISSLGTPVYGAAYKS